MAKARRRLSVDGNHIGLDGLDEVDMEVDIPSLDTNTNDLFVGVYAGQSQKGYVPFNPHKVNQDWMLIREDKVTGTLVLGYLMDMENMANVYQKWVLNANLNSSLCAIVSTPISLNIHFL